MYKVDIYARVRVACLVLGKSQRQAAKEFGLNRRTIGKMLETSIPKGYQRGKPIFKPKLLDHIDFIDEILEADRSAPVKQRHTAQRIYDRLKEEREYSGGYTTVRVYVAKARLRKKEMFIPLVHEPGWAQVDFGEAVVVINGLKKKLHLFVMDLPYSDGIFIKAYEQEITEAFLDGHISAFEFFGGVPSKILYDNLRIAVAKILGTGERKRTQAFSPLQSHYLFRDEFARIGKGNDKGNVENLVGYARRNFMVPVPHYESVEAFNEYLRGCCVKRQAVTLHGHKETIGERVLTDQKAFLPLPEGTYDPCTLSSGTVSCQSLVRYKGNDYSVPVRYGYQSVFIKGFIDKIQIVHKKDIIAEHKRSYEKGESIYDPLHYLPLIERKPRALDQAAPLKGWRLPDVFEKLRQCLEERDGKAGKKEYIQVLRLMETYRIDEVTQGIKGALQCGAISLDSIRHFILYQKDKDTKVLDLSKYPCVPSVTVSTTRLKDYDTLRGMAI